MHGLFDIHFFCFFGSKDNERWKKTTIFVNIFEGSLSF